MFIDQDPLGLELFREGDGRGVGDVDARRHRGGLSRRASASARHDVGQQRHFQHAVHQCRVGQLAAFDEDVDLAQDRAEAGRGGWRAGVPPPQGRGPASLLRDDCASTPTTSGWRGAGPSAPTGTTGSKPSGNSRPRPEGPGGTSLRPPGRAAVRGACQRAWGLCRFASRASRR